MVKKDKLIERLKRKPKDFTWKELTVLLRSLGYEEVKRGKTSGSRHSFVSGDGVVLNLHKPHPKNILKAYAVKQVLEFLTKEGHL